MVRSSNVTVRQKIVMARCSLFLSEILEDCNAEVLNCNDETEYCNGEMFEILCAI